MFEAQRAWKFFVASVFNWVISVLRGDRVSRAQDENVSVWDKLSGTGSCARRGISASAGACLQLATECILIFLNSTKKSFTLWKEWTAF